MTGPERSRLAGIPISTAAGHQFPQVAFDGTKFLVVWTGSPFRNEFRYLGARSLRRCRRRRFRDRNIWGARDQSRMPQSRFDGTNYLVVWWDRRWSRSALSVAGESGRCGTRQFRDSESPSRRATAVPASRSTAPVPGRLDDHRNRTTAPTSTGAGEVPPERSSRDRASPVSPSATVAPRWRSTAPTTSLCGKA